MADFEYKSVREQLLYMNSIHSYCLEHFHTCYRKNFIQYRLYFNEKDLRAFYSPFFMKFINKDIFEISFIDARRDTKRYI